MMHRVHIHKATLRAEQHPECEDMLLAARLSTGIWLVL
jgi:hypothetical protein